MNAVGKGAVPAGGQAPEKQQIAAVELPDYGNEYRLPFKIAGGETYDERGVSAHIVRVDPAIDYGMSRSLAQCLQDLSACIDCGKAPFPPEGHECCGRDLPHIEDVRYQILTLPDYKYTRETSTSYESVCQVLFAEGRAVLIHEEIRQDYKRANEFLRKIRQPKIPKQLLMRLKHELLALHDGHCYYCFAVIEANGDSADFDHFDPISFGGTGDVWNLVLACKQCNHDKGTAPGEVFRDAMFARADKAARRMLRILQARVDAWRENKLRESRIGPAAGSRG